MGKAANHVSSNLMRCFVLGGQQQAAQQSVSPFGLAAVFCATSPEYRIMAPLSTPSHSRACRVQTASRPPCIQSRQGVRANLSAFWAGEFARSEQRQKPNIVTSRRAVAELSAPNMNCSGLGLRGGTCLMPAFQTLGLRLFPSGCPTRDLAEPEYRTLYLSAISCPVFSATRSLLSTS